MRLSIPAFILFFAALTGIGGMAHAQQQEEQSTLLPEIDPQDIEIRSQFRARFPGLNRQPILGFDPQPRVFQIDPDRMPFMESRDDVVASLPVSQLTRPSPPGYSPLEYADRHHVFGRFGFGNYLTSEAQIWGAYKFNDNKSYAGGDLDFSSGAEDHLEEAPTTYRNLRAHAEFGTKLDQRTQLDLYGGARGDFNYSPGFPASAGSDGTNLGRRNVSGLNFGAEIRRMQSGVRGWKVGAEVRRFYTEKIERSAEPWGRSSVYSGSARYQWAGGNPSETWQLRASARGGSHTSMDEDRYPWHTLGAAMVYDRLFNYRTQVSAEAGMYGTYSRAEEHRLLFGGHLEIKQWLSDRFTLEGEVEAVPRMATREEYYELNRFLRVDQALEHNYRIGASVELSYSLYDESSLYGGVSYHREDHHAVFVYMPDTAVGSRVPEAGDYRIGFEEVTLARVYGGIAHDLLPERIWFSAEGYFQIPKLREHVDYHSSDRVPNRELWGINGSLSFRPIDRLTVEGWADLLGGRETASGTGNLDPIFLLGAQADLEFTDGLGVYAKIVNLLNQRYERWFGFEERPFQIMGGVTLKL